MSRNAGRRVAVVVLGDFGHSPRMNYHALSLAREDLQVDVVAYQGEDWSSVGQPNSVVAFFALLSPNKS